MMRILVAAVGLALAVGMSGAFAAEVIIGGVSIKLPVPADFCELSENNPSDKRMVTTTSSLVEKSGNKLVGISADCRQLADWRAGKRQLLDDYGQYQTPIAQMDQLVAAPKDSIHQLCSTLRAQGNDVVSTVAPDVKANIESALKKVKVNNMAFVGVLAEDDTACYGAQIQKMQAENGADKTQIILIGITVLKNKYIFADRFAVYASTDATSALLAKLQSTVAALHAANK
jgi:hypothetical protein